MSDAYDDYYDAAKKDGEPVIQGEHGGCIYRIAPRVHVTRTRFERRDERVNDWLDQVDRRRGPRRFAEVEAERLADLECGPRNEHVHEVFSRMFSEIGL